MFFMCHMEECNNMYSLLFSWKAIKLEHVNDGGDCVVKVWKVEKMVILKVGEGRRRIS